MLEKVYSNICKMNRGSYLKKGIAMYFANYFDLKDEKKKLYKYFCKIDRDRNGMIFFDEFVEAYHFKVGHRNDSTRRPWPRWRSSRSTSSQAGTSRSRSPSWSSLPPTSTSRSP